MLLDELHLHFRCKGVDALNFKKLVKSIFSVLKDSEVLENYERKIAHNEKENRKKENELEKLKIIFSDYKVESQIELREIINKYEPLEQKVKMIVSKIPLEIEGLSSKEVYEKYSFVDEEGWAIYRACEAIIGMNFYREYLIEDTLGWFELSDGNELRYYRELYKFGSMNYKWVNGSMTSSNVEIVDLGNSKIDYSSEEYKKYEKELYSRALVKLKDIILKFNLEQRLSFIEHVVIVNETEEKDINLYSTCSREYEEDSELEV